MELKVLNNKGVENGSVQFDERLLENHASRALLHEVVVAHLAQQRAGTHDTRTRAEVSGGGIKPWKQKHTGRARSGSTRSPLWRKGGIIFGPTPRDYSQSLPKKKKQVAFRVAVQGLIDDNRLQVVDPIELPEVKTKFVAQVYSKWKAPTDSIYLVEKIDENLRRASGNAANVQVIDVETLNVYDCLRARKIFVTKGALTKLSERISKYVGAPQS